VVKYIAKANDDVLSHCACTGALASPPGQLDCPWCGCGWMICCTECGKAFVYAKIVEVDATYKDLISADYRRRGYKTVSNENIAQDADAMERALTPFRVGEVIVYFDGSYFSLEGDGPVEFEGWYASHKLDQLPHVVACNDPAHLRGLLGETSYWLERELPDRLD